MQDIGWSRLDFLLITGDAYIDHSSFGAAVIGRYLESLGYRVGILPQPNWKKPLSLKERGAPLLGFWVF